MDKHLSFLFVVLCFFFFLLSACASAQSVLPTPDAITTDIPTQQEGAVTQGSQIDGKTLLETRCTSCHSMERITNSSKTEDAWKATVERMIGHGAQLSTEEEAVLTQYLAENFK